MQAKGNNPLCPRPNYNHPTIMHLGVRTPHEIEIERTALRILGGDFITAENLQSALRQAMR
jgi:hypothetical protein